MTTSYEIQIINYKDQINNKVILFFVNFYKFYFIYSKMVKIHIPARKYPIHIY